MKEAPVRHGSPPCSVLAYPLQRSGIRSHRPSAREGAHASMRPSSVTLTAFVLGGGGVLGAAEVGMAWALLEAGVVPDLICGTSIGAINGAALAADPTPAGAQELLAMWEELAA